MKDYIGNKLDIGDEVIFVAPGYRSFAKGKISKITAKTVFIDYLNTWNYANGHPSEVKQSGSQIIKVIVEPKV